MASREGRVKSCSGCRRHKLRCDAQQDPSHQCSRCRKMGLDCVVLPSCEKIKKQTKADLQQEINTLRQQVRSSVEATRIEPPLSKPLRPSWDISTTAVSEDQALLTLITSVNSPFSIAANLEHPTRNTSTRCTHTRTIPQTLDGQEFDARRIDDCFALFFNTYAPLLPIFDPEMSPNSYHSLSPLLFWTIVGTGCRRYPGDPTMLGYLGPRITNLAMFSLSSNDAPLQVILALLLLCTWPVLIKTLTKGVTHVLSGAAMHLAMQIGLHVFGIGQDFAGSRLRPDNKEKTLRARIWLQCLIVCQSTSCAEGMPPLIFVDSLIVGREQNDMLAVLSEDERFRQKLHGTQTAAIVAMVRNGLTLDLTMQTNVIGSLVRLFDAQVNNVTHGCQSQLNMLYLSCARLHIQTFYFFENPDRPDMEGLTELFSIARMVIDNVMALDQTQICAVSSTAYIHRSVILSAFTILKISKSLLKPYLDLESGKKSYFFAIALLRMNSLENDDLSAMGAMILTQLWTSSKIFRRANGAMSSLRLSVRSRMTMSVVFDCFWWWREEFGGRPSPFRDEEDYTAKELGHSLPHATPDAALESQQLEFALPMNDGNTSLALLSDQGFPDYDWAASFDYSTDK